MKVENHSYYVAVGQRPRFADDAVVVQRVKQRDESWLWKVEMASLNGGPVLNRDLEWEYNSRPSDRDDEEIHRTRYASVDEALSTIILWMEDGRNAQDPNSQRSFRRRD